MILLELLSSGLILILPILVVVFIFRWLNKGAPAQHPAMTEIPRPQPVALPSDRDQQWRSFIAGFKAQNLNKTQTALIEMILNSDKAPDAMAYAAVPAEPYAAMPLMDVPAPPPPAEPEQEIDGTVLLLYFGAFLFVASAGLFVAFSGLSGGFRTFIVVIAMLTMYCGGFWLHNRSTRLRPAGVAFVAIGMAIAPLVGVATFHFIAAQRYAILIWVLTSILCCAMYALALLRLHYTFISYLVIFSFLSLFESFVAITDASVYYYVWALIIAGMILRFTGFIRENSDLDVPAAISAQVLIPLSLLVSLAMIPGNGSGQLSISLLLSAVYYTFETLMQKASPRAEYLAAAAQVLYLLGVSVGSFALFDSRLLVATGLTILVVVQGVIIDAVSPRSILARNFATVAFVSAVPAIFLSYPNGVLMSVAVAVAAAVGALAAWRQMRPDMYAGAALTGIALPFVIGQIACDPHWSANVQTAAAFVPVLVLWRLWSTMSGKRSAADAWLSVASTTYVLAGVAALIPAGIRGGWLGIAAAVAFALTMAVAARLGAGSSWWAGAGVIISLPVIRELGANDTTTFSVAVGLALLGNIAISLLSRSEVNRWLVTILGLVAPVAIGGGGLHYHASAVGYAYWYLLAMFCLLLCRALARGVYLVSVKAPIASLYRSASLSYVFGYIASAMLSVLISLTAANSRLHTSIILGVLLVVTPYIATTIEKNKRYLAFVPWLMMALLVSLVRPTVNKGEGSIVILAVSALAILAYTTVVTYQAYLSETYREVLASTLVFAYAPVVLALWYRTAPSVPPVALAVAGFLTLQYYWDKSQSSREISGGVIVVAGLWLLNSFGVHNPQAYTHIIAAVFGLYAYWRYFRRERESSDQYLYAMLGMATIPLALQTLSGTAGDAYGWWLLLEQIGFMLLGIYISRRFVVMWGLYVALGAVLYQLRNLGWAALSFLALFIIGMAVWRLMRSVDHHDGPGGPSGA